MAAGKPPAKGAAGMQAFAKAHKPEMIGGGALAVVVLALYEKNKSASTSTTAAATTPATTDPTTSGYYTGTNSGGGEAGGAGLGGLTAVLNKILNKMPGPIKKVVKKPIKKKKKPVKKKPVKKPVKKPAPRPTKKPSKPKAKVPVIKAPPHVGIPKVGSASPKPRPKGIQHPRSPVTTGAGAGPPKAQVNPGGQKK
jgi:hypothetical protein